MTFFFSIWHSLGILDFHLFMLLQLIHHNAQAYMLLSLCSIARRKIHGAFNMALDENVSSSL